MAARIFRLEWASESVSSAASDGAGAIGDSTGTTITPIYNHNRYYSESRTFYNRNNYYRGGPSAADLTERAAMAPRLQRTAWRSFQSARRQPGHSREAPRLPEDMPSRAVKAASARARSATTTMAESQEAIRRVEASSFGGGGWRRGGGVAAVAVAAGVAGAGNRSFVMPCRS